MYTDGIVNSVTDENGGWNAMRYGITEGLFKFNDSMEVEPWLADSYTVNDEHTEWVITLKDALLALRAVAQLGTLTDEQKIRADVNSNGAVDIGDVLRIMQYVNGSIASISEA